MTNPKLERIELIRSWLNAEAYKEFGTVAHDVALLLSIIDDQKREIEKLKLSLVGCKVAATHATYRGMRLSDESLISEIVDEVITEDEQDRLEEILP